MTENQSGSVQEASSSSGIKGVLIPLAIFIAISGLFLDALQTFEPSKLPSALIGKDVPVFNLPAIKGYDGAPGFSNKDLSKGEVSVVNVWASWCVPCHTEHPHLVTLAKLSKAPLFGINYKDTPGNARRFLGRYGNPYKYIGADAKGRAAIDWGVYGVPETFIVDGKGRIAYKHVGPITPDIIQKRLLPIIEKVRSTN